MVAFLEKYCSWVGEVNKRRSLATDKCKLRLICWEKTCAPHRSVHSGELSCKYDRDTGCLAKDKKLQFLVSIRLFTISFPAFITWESPCLGKGRTGTVNCSFKCFPCASLHIPMIDC